VTLRAPGGAVPNLLVYDYFNGDTKVDPDGYSLPSETLRQPDLERGLSRSLPPRSVEFLTTQGAP